MSNKYPRGPVKKLSDCIMQFLDEEVRIIGKISRLYFQGRQLYPSAGEDTEAEPVKKKHKSYIIIPIKNRDSAVEFIKIPIMKAETHVRAKNIGNVKIQRITSDGSEATEKLPLWITDKSCIPQLGGRRGGFPKGGSVEFVYKRGDDRTGPPKQEPSSSKKFRCRRKTKGTPPKDKKKDKPKRKKSRTSDKD